MQNQSSKNIRFRGEIDDVILFDFDKVKGRSFKTTNFESLIKLEACKSIEEINLSINSYIQKIGTENLLKYFRRAKKLTRFQLKDYNEK